MKGIVIILVLLSALMLYAHPAKADCFIYGSCTYCDDDYWCTWDPWWE